MRSAAFAARIPERDRGFLDRFLLYDVAVAGWTQPTPARRIAALEGADVVGLVTVEPQRGWMDHVGDFRVVVQPDARRTGVGAALIDHGVELARSLGVSKLSVEVMASNEGGLGLFERHGFDARGRAAAPRPRRRGLAAGPRRARPRAAVAELIVGPVG